MAQSETLFISDLHLDESRPDITQCFIEFTKTRATQARVLYILGDLFEVWIGDDDPADALTPVFDALLRLTKTTQVFFMVGNRDFLVGQQLAKKLHFELLSEPTIITLNQQKTALLHGDSLCTGDIDYQTFRAKVRSEKWQTSFLAQSLSERKAIVQKLRADSKQATQLKSSLITDVSLSSVLDCFDELGVTQMIHGHTHRPAVHHFKNAQGVDLTRFVLGDWQPNASFISADNETITLHDPRT